MSCTAFQITLKKKNRGS